MSNWKNKLFYGDNLEMLRKRVKDETVDLAYIDPPFNSKRNYNQIYNNVGNDDRAQAQAFVDTWTWNDHAIQCYEEILANENGVQTQQSIALISGLEKVLGKGALFAYLVSMTIRIAEIHRGLKPTGSFYLHCDPTASHYLKLCCDAIFVTQGGDYRNEIIWKRTTAHGDSRQGAKHFGRVNDVILFYTKGESYTWNQLFAEYSADYLESKYRNIEPETGRRYQLDNITGPGGAAKGNPSYEFLGVTRFWRYSKERMQQLYSEGRIVQPSPGAVPRYKRYLDEMSGHSLQSLWADIDPINSQAAERLGYPTQKPEALLERIIKTSSNEKDVVLDAFCGCGTTIAVAERLKRHWIGIDITYQSISLVLRRLEYTFGSAVLDSITITGVPRDMDSAVALANKKDDRLRKEFEKWSVLTYTNNRAIINDKKGADQGIDGIAYFLTGKDENAKIVFQVKSGGVKRDTIATLRGDMEREQAAIAVLITLEKPTAPMVKEAKAAGQFRHESMGKNYDRIQIVTVKEIVEEGKRLEIPMSLEVLKAAKREVEDRQQNLFGAA